MKNLFQSITLYKHTPLIAMIVAMILWGSAWPCAKAISHLLESDALSFWRFFLNTIALLPFFFFAKRPSYSRQFFTTITAGTVAMTLYLLTYFMGMKLGSAHLAGIIFNSINPLLIFLLSSMIFATPISLREKFALALGFSGTLLVLDLPHLSLDGFLKGGNILFIMSSLFWAMTTIISQKGGKSVTPFEFSFFTALGGSLIFFFLCDKEMIYKAFELDYFFWGMMVYISFATSALASTIYFYAVKQLGSARASSFIFIVPLSAVALSGIFLHEEIALISLLGGALSLSAVMMINTTRNKLTQEKR
jgi:drug/metabolite transporter (DMT)-like permease